MHSVSVAFTDSASTRHAAAAAASNIIIHKGRGEP
jgi:hypothetical protein